MFPFLDFGAINPALRAGFDAQAGLLASLSQHNVDLFIRLSELNLQLTRQALETTLDTGRQLCACTEPAQLATTAMHGWQPLSEHVRHYQEAVMGVLADTQSGTQTDLGNAAAQAQAQAQAQAPAEAMFAAAMAADHAADAARRPH